MCLLVLAPLHPPLLLLLARLLLLLLLLLLLPTAAAALPDELLSLEGLLVGLLVHRLA